MRIDGVSVPVLTADIESAIARYQALLREQVKARFVVPERGLTIAALSAPPYMKIDAVQYRNTNAIMAEASPA